LAMWLGYLFFISPEINDIFKDVLKFIENIIADRDAALKKKIAVYSDLLEAA